MPGLVGIVNKGNIKKDILDKMVKSLTHESWYKIDKFFRDEFEIARVHLGILNPEHQPIYNENKSLSIFMDGEIFDYEKDKENLRQKGHKFYVNNDPEFCLHLYEEHGKRFVEKLNGSFVIAILDIQKHKLSILNDRYGLRPLYYAKRDDKLVFASEVKAILEDKEFKKEINDEAVAEFFTFGQLLGNKTFFKGIEVLPPASILKWENGNISIERYWEFRYDETVQNYSEDYYVEELVKLFKQAVERRLKGDQRFGVLLSGGLDSRAILAALDNPIATLITVGFPEIDSTPKFAKKIAEIKNFNHNILELKRDFLVDFAKEAVYLTDGMFPSVHFTWISLLTEIKEYCDVLLFGWGVEGTLKGQFLNREILYAKSDEELCNTLYSRYALIKDESTSSLFSTQYYDVIAHKAFQNLNKEIKKIKNKHPANKTDIFVFLNRELRLLGMGTLHIRSRIEDREPFRDNELIDFALKIPPELRYNNHIFFKFLKRLSPELFNIPVSPTDAKISVPVLLYKLLSLKSAIIRKIIKIVRSKSRGFIKIPLKTDYPDYGEWIRVNERLRQWVEDILLDERTLSREYFNREFIVKMISDHMAYKRDYTQLIFLLLTFELWYRMFIEGEVVA